MTLIVAMLFQFECVLGSTSSGLFRRAWFTTYCGAYTCGIEAVTHMEEAVTHMEKHPSFIG